MSSDWRAKIPSLGESLGYIFETGLYSDVAFLIGKDEFKINAHKTILSARSEALAVMFHERWNPATGATQEIKMPRNNKIAVKYFLKFLYTDMITFGSVEIDDTLEITHLAHMYEVHKLLDQCIAHLTANISEKNCLQIHKSCQPLDKNLSDKALQFFLANVVPTAKSNNAYLTWDYATMEKILRDEREHVPEPTLSKALQKWGNVDSGRNAAFNKLISLIRFPTMTPKDFAAEVVPTGVLSQGEIVEVFTYISTQSGSVSFPTKRRESLVPAGAIRDTKRVKICGTPTAVHAHLIQNTFAYTGTNIHRFSLTVRNSSGTLSRIPSTTNTESKLYGMKFFSSGANNADLIAHLQSRSYKIKVAVDCYPAFGQTKVIEKTIVELNQHQMRAYFDSPMVISKNNTYVIATGLTQTAGAPRNNHAINYGVCFQLAQLISSHNKPVANFDVNGDNLYIQTIEGTYSLIDELLFSSPDEPTSCSDCRIS